MWGVGCEVGRMFGVRSGGGLEQPGSEASVEGDRWLYACYHCL